MTITSLRAVPAVLALALASVGFSAVAQTTAPASSEPSTLDKAKATGGKAVDATERTAKKAWTGTKKVAKKTGNAVAGAGHKTADGMRSVGGKIGEKIPGTAENEAAKKP
jgi:hypothetical protein